MRMGHALRRFQRERGVTLSRPMAANSPLQSYFVDPNFAAVATSRAFGAVGTPLMGFRRWALGADNRASVVDRADNNSLLDGNAGLRGGRR